MDGTEPSNSSRTSFIIIILILILLIIGLVIWIGFLIHDRVNSNTTPNCTQCASLNCPPNCSSCTPSCAQCIQIGCCGTGTTGAAAMPFYLYGFSDSTTDFDLTTSLGVITLISGGTALQVQEAAQDNTFQQWYIVPTSGVSAVIQNVATQQYLQGNTGNNTLTVINGIQSATQFNIQLETQAGPMGGGTGVANGVSFNGNPGATAYYINISGGGTSVIFYPDSTIQSNDIWVMLPAISDVF